MDNKLERFLKAINFSIDNYSYFDNAKVDDVLLNKKLCKIIIKR